MSLPAASVLVKRAGDARARFAEVPIFEGDTITRLAERASLKLAWGASAAYVELFLVKPAGGGEQAFATPTQVQIDAVLADERNVLGEGMPLLLAGVAAGAWVVARLPDAPTAAPAPHAELLATAHSRARADAEAGGAAGHAANRADWGGGEQRSYQTVVGPTFEGEARSALGSIFREVCPWATRHSDILSRKLDRDDNPREGDLMCYLEGDLLGPCVALPSHGVRVVEVAPPDAAVPPLPAIELPASTQFSPTDPSRRGPHKYFICEAYSGADRTRMREKVAQLETLCGILRQRWEAQHAGVRPIEDLTQVVGAAALVFSAGDSGRRVVLGHAVDLVSRFAGQNLRRLVAAGRLFVVVLEKGQSPHTFFQRATAAALDAVARDVDAVARDMTAVKAGVAALVAAQTTNASIGGGGGGGVADCGNVRT